MIRSDEHWLKLADNFSNAALGASSWDLALAGLAEACGARGGQLIGFGADAAIPFNLVTGADPQMGPDLVSVNGGDPKVNPRVRAALTASELQVLVDNDYVVDDEMIRPGPYADMCRKYDFPFVCQTNLIKEDGLLIGLAVLRTSRQGHITREDRDAFKVIAPHVRAAVRTQMILEGRGAELLAGALESMSFAAFACDRHGRVRAMTPTAEKLARENSSVRLKLGYLQAASHADDLVLCEAIYEAAHRSGPKKTRLVRTVVLHRKPGNNSAPLLLDVIALPPQPLEFTSAARVLIVARGNRTDAAQNTFLLQTAFGLTGAEAEVALLLAGGHSIETISLRRAVSDSTIRSQIKSVFSKLGISRQMELAALLKEFH